MNKNAENERREIARRLYALEYNDSLSRYFRVGHTDPTGAPCLKSRILRIPRVIGLMVMAAIRRVRGVL